MDFENFFLDLLEGIGNVDFTSVGKYFLIGFVLFWFAIVWWVWFDASERTTKIWAKIASVILVAVFNIFGLIIYLVIRPDQTIEGTYWEDLERRYMKYETSELGDCPQCNAQLLPGFIFCSNCGYELKVKCSNCEVFVDRNYKFCPFCSNQIRDRAVREEVELKPEEMEAEVQATKDEITEVVESDKTKYSKKESIVTKIGESVIGGYKLMLGSLMKKRAELMQRKELSKEEKSEEKSVSREDLSEKVDKKERRKAKKKRMKKKKGKK